MFSVLVPVYNHEEYLTEAVFSALASPLVSEVLLADDGSSDNSVDIIGDLARSDPNRVRDLTETGRANMGAHARLNALAAAAKNEWLSILNSDDVFLPGRFALIERMAALSDSEFFFGDITIIDAQSSRIGRKRGPYDPQYPFPRGTDVMGMVSAGALLPLLISQNYLATTSNMVFTRTLFERVGGFRNLRYCHDWDFAIRCMMLGRVRYLDEYITEYRLHGRNTIGDGLPGQRKEVRAIFAALAAEYGERFCGARDLRFLESNRYLGPKGFQELSAHA